MEWSVVLSFFSCTPEVAPTTLGGSTRSVYELILIQIVPYIYGHGGAVFSRNVTIS